MLPSKRKTMYKLMVKTHERTGFKYLCKTEKEDHLTYHGSGTEWKRHLAEHGSDCIKTEVLLQVSDLEEFKFWARFYSHKYNVVESPEWANMRIEEGDGGDTVSGKFWITNGVADMYLDSGKPIPEGWRKGRSTGAFKDPEKQREFSKRADPTKRGTGIKKAWDEGKFSERKHAGISGDRNPAKSASARAKIAEAQCKPITLQGKEFKSIKDAMAHFNVPRHVIDKMRKNG